MEAQKVIIRMLNIYSPIIDKNNQLVKIYNNDFCINNYIHFPIILNKGNTQWEDANRYLLYRLKTTPNINPMTLDVIARDLRDFKRYCDCENINYLYVPRKILRPNWLYREYLNKKVMQGNLSPNSLKRKLSSITGFYDWLINIENIKFKFDLWDEKETYISYKDDKGFRQNKKVIIKDITNIPHTKNTSIEYNNIVDGGKLRPLSVEEQFSIFKALKVSKNIEMELLFLLAISTGARLQTICTLRLEQFTRIPLEEENEIRIRIGYGTLCDTKYSRQNILFIPKWVYQKIQLYINSNKAKKRRNKAKHIFSEEKYQYVFLTNRGISFYVSRSDDYISQYISPPKGETIRVFISNTLKKILKEMNINIQFSFHDLRATYGINFIDSYAELIKEKKISITKVLIDLKERMGHSNLETTEQYLNFRSKTKLTFNAQNKFEKYLRGLIDDFI